MDRGGFVRLSVIALGTVIASFFVLGFSRLVVSVQTAQLLAAPLGLVGFGLIIYLFVRATLAAAGLWEIGGPDG